MKQNLNRRTEVGLSFYSSVHYWLKFNYGVATKCEGLDCRKNSKNYQWALKRDKPYAYDVANFIQLCASCHRRYDCTDLTRAKMRELNKNTSKTHCKRGHEFTPENTLSIKGGRARMCKQCSAISKKNIKSYKKTCPVCSKDICSKSFAKHLFNMHNIASKDIPKKCDRRRLHLLDLLTQEK